MVNRTEKTCRNIQHVRRDNIWEMSNLICGKAAVGENYNLTHDSQQYRVRYIWLPELLSEYADKSLLPSGKNKVLNKYAAFKVLIMDEWLIQDLSKEDIEFIFELSERRFDSTSTIFCTLYRQEEWVNRLGGGAYAESIVERFAYNVTWIETGDVNMRQIYVHA